MQTNCRKTQALLIVFLISSLLLLQFAMTVSFMEQKEYPVLSLRPDAGFQSDSPVVIRNLLNSLESSGIYEVMKLSERELEQTPGYRISKTCFALPLNVPLLSINYIKQHSRFIDTEAIEKNSEILLHFLHDQDGMK